MLAASFGKSEQSAKEDISGEELELERKLGIARDAETVDVEDKGQVFLQREILGVLPRLLPQAHSALDNSRSGKKTSLDVQSGSVGLNSETAPRQHLGGSPAGPSGNWGALWPGCGVRRKQ